MKFEFPKLYTEFAKYYDRLENQYRDYSQETRWISKLLDDHSVSSAIDISCGTGSHLAGLVSTTSRTFVGLDASAEMIELAKEKLPNRVLLVRGDFLSTPFRERFDAAMCMYWSIAGLDDGLVRKLFLETNSILKKEGLFIFDTENSDGIKEELLNTPFIDSFFPDGQDSVVRVNFSTRSSKDTVDWHAYYLVESGGVSQLLTDKMNLRFYSRNHLESLLEETGFTVLEVLSGPFKEYRQGSPSLYFVAEKK